MKFTEFYLVVDGIGQGWQNGNIDIVEFFHNPDIESVVYREQDFTRERLMHEYGDLVIYQLISHGRNPFVDACYENGGIAAAVRQTSDLQGGDVEILGGHVVRYTRYAYNRSGSVSWDFINNRKADLRTRAYRGLTVSKKF